MASVSVADEFRGDALGQRAFSVEEIRKRQAIAVEQLLAAPVEDGETGARHGHRHASQNRR